MTKKTTRTRAEAKRLMWEYYRQNKESLPGWIKERREEVISYLIAGQSAPRAFETLINNVEFDTETVVTWRENSMLNRIGLLIK